MTIAQIIQTVAVVATCMVTVGGILVYVGRSLSTLNHIAESVEVLFRKAERYESDIARLDKEMTQVRTKQEDCSQCP